MQTYQIYNPDNSVTRNTAQNLLDQADEDFLCAIGCLRNCQHDPLNEVCYLLHQSLEKWLKVALQMSNGNFPHSHKIKEDILPEFCGENPDITQKPDLREVRIFFGRLPIVIDKSYPSYVRYRENNHSLNEHVEVLLGGVFLTRRLVKKWLKNREVVI
jgi:hypothetical protein